jgi:hypothetical protein
MMAQTVQRVRTIETTGVQVSGSVSDRAFTQIGELRLAVDELTAGSATLAARADDGDTAIAEWSRKMNALEDFKVTVGDGQTAWANRKRLKF